MRIQLVNCSGRYNLGLAKAEAYHVSRGDVVAWADRVDLLSLEYDAVYLSALFTWDLPDLARDALWAKEMGLHVEMGGPAAMLMADWVEERVGLPVHRGLVPEWEEAWRVGGIVRPMTFTSRGCVRRCPFCAVPRLEPEFYTIPDFAPAPIVLDSNILACDDVHLARVVERLRGLREVDVNQGFDARLFDAGTLDRLRGLPIKVWRFAFDTLAVEGYVSNAVETLRKRTKRSNVRVYVLFGYDDTIEEAEYRADCVIRWGGSPWAMAYVPLDWTSKERYVPAGWERQRHIDFRRFYCRPRLWGSIKFAEYRRDYRRKRPCALAPSPDDTRKG